MATLTRSTSLLAEPSSSNDMAGSVNEPGATVSYPKLPLDRSKQEIRLLHLQPALFGGKLRGRLEVVSLERKPKYEALSYTWGARTLYKTILLNDNTPVPVTDNLYKCLRRLRYHRPWKTRTIWIDAICINQGDPRERGHQVAFMLNIYRSAEKLCVWLGDVVGLSWWHRLRLVIVPVLGTVQDDAVLNNVNSKIWTGWWKQKISRWTLDAYRIGLDSALSSSLPRWHDRVWVYQELKSAQNRQVSWCFGSNVHTSSISQFEKHLLLMPGGNSSKAILNFWYSLQQMHPQSEHIQGIRKSLYHHCFQTSNMEASNPRDRVFSLLGLVSAAEADLITVDYQRTCAEVFAQATFASIAGSEKLEVLNLIRPVRSDHVPSLPTWSLDMLDLNYLSRNFPPGDLALQECPRIVAHLSACSTQLQVNVNLFDSIQSVDILTNFHRAEQIELPPGLICMQAELSKSGYGAYSCTAYGKLIRRRQTAYEPHGNLLAKLNGIDRRYDFRARSETLSSVFQWWEDHLDLDLALQPSKNMPYGRRTGAERLHQAIMESWPNHFFITRGGFLGLSCYALQPHDVVVMARGADLPMILRPTAEKFEFKGFAYMAGIMNGELQGFWQENGFDMTRITLI